MARAATTGVPAFAPWVRTDWRRRRRTLLILVLLVGVAAGGVMAAVAGARRSATSLERLAQRSGTSDTLVDVGEGGLPAAERIGTLPSVEAVAPVTLVFAVVDGVDADIGLFLPRSRQGRDPLERDRLLRGERPAPDQADQVLINEPMAQLSGLDVGDHFEIQTLTPAQVQAQQYAPPRGPTIAVTVAGVTRGPSDLVARAEGNITATPALYPRVAGKVDEFAMYVAVRLRPDATAADFERDLKTIAPKGVSLDVLSTADRTRPARRTISTLAVGLAVLAAVAALAVVVAVSQIVARHVGGGAPDERIMGALGMDRRQRAWALAATVLPVVLLAPPLAVAVAIVLSPLTPIGLARRAEPAPGVRLDLPLLLIGGLVTAVVVALVAAIAASRATHPPRLRPVSRPSSVATMAARVGMPPPVVHGAALAYHAPSTGRPVRSAVAVALAVIVAVGAMTFAASLSRLGGSSERWGSPWDLSLDFTSGEVGRAARQLVADEGLSSVGRWDSGAALVNGEYVRASGLDRLRGDLGFTLVEGQQPSSGEVVIGPQTAERGGLEVGDRVSVSSPEGGGGKLRIAGIALFPEVDDGDLIDGVGMTAEDFATHASVPDEFEASQVVVRVAPGSSVGETEDRLRARFGGALDEPRPVRPGAVGNILDIRSIPRVLLAFTALLALASLALTVRSTTERHAADFTTLRAIGMTRRQRWECSLAQAVALAAGALLVGVPLGIAAGRATWNAVARSIDVVPAPVTPVLALTLVVAGSFAVALVASVAGRAAIGHGGPTIATGSPAAGVASH